MKKKLINFQFFKNQNFAICFLGYGKSGLLLEPVYKTQNSLGRAADTKYYENTDFIGCRYYRIFDSILE